MANTIEVQRLFPTTPLPQYATPMSAAVDLNAVCCFDLLDLERKNPLLFDAPIKLYPNETRFFGTGLKMNLRDWKINIIPRSGLGTQGLVLSNVIGLIDGDYQGHIMLPLWNRSEEVITVEPNMRVAQGQFEKIQQVTFVVVDEFAEETARGEGGFGHSGHH